MVDNPINHYLLNIIIIGNNNNKIVDNFIYYLIKTNNKYKINIIYFFQLCFKYSGKKNFNHHILIIFNYLY